MAVDCLACMLGIHKRSFYNALSGKVDMRIGRKARVATKTVDVDRFFLDLYVCVGECLPDKFIRRGARLHGKHLLSAFEEVSEPSSDEDNTEERRLKDLDRDLAAWYSHSTFLGSALTSLATLSGLDISKLEKRKLPPGNIIGLYAQYLLQRGALLSRRSKKSRTSGMSMSTDAVSSEAEGEHEGVEEWSQVQPEPPSTASWSTFLASWTNKWRHVLEFKHESQHTVCDEC